MVSMIYNVNEETKEYRIIVDMIETNFILCYNYNATVYLDLLIK